MRADYTWIKDEAYRESGAGALNLSVDGRSAQQLVFGADGKVSRQLNAHSSVTGNLGVGYDTLADKSAITATFAGAPDAAFVSYGLDPSPWLVRGGVGMVYQTNGNLQVTARYDVDARSSFLNQTVSAKLSWAF